ncbi:hypothetical protein [Parapedobacter sp. DT-150]|uniref:hypothetical protein n=1 Tax=Parapedobacter sp. DT-150 TaxID=3396162 RepID=UPI003F1D2140
MAKSKIGDRDVLTYLHERRQSLYEELSKIEAALISLGVDITADKKYKKQNKKKKKHEKAVKVLLKQAAKKASPADPAPVELTKPIAKPKRLPKPPKAAATPEAIATVAAAAVKEPKEQPARRKRRTTATPEAIATVAATAVKRPRRKASFDPSATMDQKIRYALEKKPDSTKEELIDHLNGLDPDYGLSKLKKVVAFRLNHLLKTGTVTGRERDGGFRYTL